MKSVMEHRFSETPHVEIPRSTFQRNHGVKTTFDAGYLVPIFLDEVLPGDTFDLRITGFSRLSTPVYPIMDNMFMETFFFFVPMRQTWENSRKFFGERDPDPDSSIDYTVPVIDDDGSAQNWANQSIWDYFGLPTQVNDYIETIALPLRSYNHIWNQWFRDQNLQDSVAFNVDDGPDDQADYTLLRRGKRHDYFTSCLPWPQKGDSVQLSLGTVAPVTGIGVDNQSPPLSSQTLYETAGTAGVTYANSWAGHISSEIQIEQDTTNLGYPNIYADLNAATASTVNELRQAIQIQRLLERDARAGTRYNELVQSHFGVSFPDLTYRPVYLGGGSTPVNITPIARTDGSPGELGAMGVANFENHGFVQSFNEHGYVIGLVNVRADLTYQEGLNRLWSRQTRYDYYWPTLAHLGEQAVLNKEIYVDAADIAAGTTEEVFGYQERYAEYRYKPSLITGKFRSNDAASLDAWHLGIEFGATPTLDDTFIQDDPPIDRIIATPSEPHFIFDSYIQLKCTRPMPVYSIPGLIDHF